MKVLLEKTLNIDYGQIYIESGDNAADEGIDEVFVGQKNGLLGASLEGVLFLVTGLNGGALKFKAVFFEEEPPIEDKWEEIVEASVNIQSGGIQFREWGMGDDEGHPLDLQSGWHRVRYCGIGMDLEHIFEDDDEECVPEDEYYEIMFWPEEKAKDNIIKCTSERAKYWHSEWGNP